MSIERVTCTSLKFCVAYQLQSDSDRGLASEWFEAVPAVDRISAFSENLTNVQYLVPTPTEYLGLASKQALEFVSETFWTMKINFKWQKLTLLERASQKKQIGGNYSSVAPSSEELRRQKDI